MSRWTAPKTDTGDLPSIEILRRSLYIGATGELRWTLEPRQEDYPDPRAWKAARERAGDIAERSAIGRQSWIVLFGRKYLADRIKRAMLSGSTNLSRITLPSISGAPGNYEA